MKPRLPSYKEVLKYLERIELNRIYSNHGPLVQELEAKYASYFGIDSSQVVAMANATLALQACVQISDKKIWAVPNFTFAATGLAVLQAQKNVILLEVRAIDWQMNLNLINKSSCGLVPVLPFGAPVDLNQYKFFDEVVIDAAASLGAPIYGIKDMNPNHFIVFSLHATKVLGAGEGAVVVCGCKETANVLRSWLNFGFNGFRESNILGSNAKMSEFSAAFGLASFDHLETEKREWLHVLNQKSSILRENGLDNFSDHLPGFRPYWIFDAQNLDSNLLISKFRNNDIETRRWWPKPLSKMKVFNKIEVVGGEKIADSLAQGLIGLPFWRDMPIEIFENILSVLVKETVL